MLSYNGYVDRIRFITLTLAILVVITKRTLCKDTSTLLENGDKGVCVDKRCKLVAKRMLKALNQSVDPCSNFYQYACGGWMNSHKIPEKKEEFSAINELSDNNDKVLKQLLADKYAGSLCSKNHTATTKTLMKVKNFYKSCIDLKRINELGAKPLQDFIERLGSWDIAGTDEFDVDRWDFQRTLRLLHAEYPAEIFFTVDVDVDPKNRTRNIITVSVTKHYFHTWRSSLTKDYHFLNRGLFVKFTFKPVGAYSGGGLFGSGVLLLN